MTNKITIDLSELNLHAEHAPEFALKIDGEDHLLKLVEIKNQVEEIYKNALNKLAEQSLEYNKDIRVIDGSKVRVSLSRVGKKYEADLNQVDEAFVKTIKSLDSDAVGEYLKKHEELPKNVKLMPDSDRPLSVRVKVKDDIQA